MKTVYIDLDGTLLNSKLRHQQVLEDIFSELNIKKDLSGYILFKLFGGNTKRYLIDCLEFDETLVEKIVRKWIRRIEDDEYLCLDVLYDDSIWFLKNLKALGYSIILLTARNNKIGLSNFLLRVHLLQWFDDIKVVSPFNLVNEKRKILSEGEMDSIYIGDTDVDFNIARSLGVRVYILNRGFRDKEYLNKKGCCISYDNLLDVYNAICGGLM